MGVNTVFLKNMPFMLPIDRDAWCRGDKTQPVNITLRVNHVKSIYDAAATDNVSKSLDYGKLYKTIQSELGDLPDSSNPLNIARQVLASVKLPGTHCFVEVDLPKAALRAEGGVRLTVDRDNDVRPTNDHEMLYIRDIKCACIIGVNPHERREKQIVIVNLVFDDAPEFSPGSKIDITDPYTAFAAMTQYHEIIEMVVKVCQPLVLASPCCSASYCPCRSASPRFVIAPHPQTPYFRVRLSN